MHRHKPQLHTHANVRDEAGSHHRLARQGGHLAPQVLHLVRPAVLLATQLAQQRLRSLKRLLRLL